MSYERWAKLFCLSVVVCLSMSCASAMPVVEDGGARDAGVSDGAPAGDGGVDAGADVDAGVDSGIECTPGATRTAPCAPCGTLTDVCEVDGHWVLGTTCVQGGACLPGTVDYRVGYDAANQCGRDERTCTATCTWGPWETVRPGYVDDIWGGWGRLYGRLCADKTKSFDYYNLEDCYGHAPPLDETNQWTCGAGCGGSPRVAIDEAEREVCIPAVGHYRWGPIGQDRDITMTSYYIDRHAMSYQRYQRCVDAGACTPLTPKVRGGVTISDDPADNTDEPLDDYVIITATLEQARTFCAWDGGRELPSGLQWERAFRDTFSGATDVEWPKKDRFFVGPCTTDFPDCDSPEIRNPPFSVRRVWETIATVSPDSWKYGVDDLFVFYEYTRSWYPDPPYALPGTDELAHARPEYPPFGHRIQMRSMSYQEPYGDASRGFTRVTPDIGFGTFRCSRWAE